jgi:hypothetical protein
LNQRVCTRIDGSCSLVKYKHTRVSQQRACQTHQLSLANLQQQSCSCIMYMRMYTQDTQMHISARAADSLIRRHACTQECMQAAHMYWHTKRACKQHTYVLTEKLVPPSTTCDCKPCSRLEMATSTCASPVKSIAKSQTRIHMADTKSVTPPRCTTELRVRYARCHVHLRRALQISASLCSSNGSKL